MKKRGGREREKERKRDIGSWWAETSENVMKFNGC